MQQDVVDPVIGDEENSGDDVVHSSHGTLPLSSPDLVYASSSFDQRFDSHQDVVYDVWHLSGVSDKSSLQLRSC